MSKRNQESRVVSRVNKITSGATDSRARNAPRRRPVGAAGHLTPAQIADLEAYLLSIMESGECLSFETIACDWGVSRFTLWKRIRDDDELSAAFDEYAAYKIDMARSSLMEMATGDIPVDRDRLQAISLFLARYDVRAIRWRMRDKPNHSEGPIEIVVVTPEAELLPHDTESESE